MNSLRGKGLAILAVVLCVVYFGYRFYVGGIDAAVLKDATVDSAIQRVSVINPKSLPTSESITLPGIRPFNPGRPEKPRGGRLTNN